MLKHLRLSRPLAVVDTETTGLIEHGGRIVEIALVRVFPGGCVSACSHRIDPGTEIPEFATRIHGIRTEDVVGCGPWSQYDSNVRAKLMQADLCGFNIRRFDLPMISSERQRSGLGPLRLWDSAHIVDVMELFHSFLPLSAYGRPAKGTGTLDAACARYLGGSLPAAHGALRDALASLWVLDAMIATEHLPCTVPELALVRKPGKGAPVRPGRAVQGQLIDTTTPPRPWGPESEWGPEREWAREG
jgi:DNA polymerase-3 subunit epsilon